MALLPIALELQHRPVLVVGGGKVAARKVALLLEAGAQVTVVSPSFVPEFPVCERHERAFEEADVDKFALVFAATNDSAVNARVGNLARERGIWFNDASDPESSDFHTASVVRRGPITIGVTTNRTSPALAKFVRERVEEAVGPEFETLLELVEEIPLQSRGAFWKSVLGSDVLDLLRDGHKAEARGILDDIVRALHVGNTATST